MKSFSVIFPAIISVMFLFSCGGDKKQSQSNISNVTDEEKQFALSLYGDEVKILIKGDLLGNGKQSAIAAVVRKQTDNSWWIQKGSFIEKEPGGWKVILKMEDKLSSLKGDLISQVDAKNGYVISFDSTKKPLSINIVMANEYGKGTSDDAILNWNKDKETFEFRAPYEDALQ